MYFFYIQPVLHHGLMPSGWLKMSLLDYNSDVPHLKSTLSAHPHCNLMALLQIPWKIFEY